MSISFWNPRLHLQPRNGWLNDPNGLCEFNGFYHAFYQYAPEWPQDELKHWGHCTSKDLLHWSDQGIALSPDINEDQNGVFSGSAWIDHGASPDGEDLMRVFYTGNVVDTTIDERIDEGREANEIMVTSKDGVHFSEKKVLLRNGDYPQTCTLHVRDPKVWEQDGALHMLLGARERGVNDTPNIDERGDFGCVLVYDSNDSGESWKLRTTIRPVDAKGNPHPFGYMWECPNLCRLGGYEFLAVCPQGLPSKTFRWHNMWQAGYFPLPQGEKIIDATAVNVDSFTEWDCGFDFYAPQIFEDGRGRTISIGWMGTFDASYTSAPEGMDRCHVMTLPREIYADEKGTLHQVPIRELKERRKAALPLQNDTTLELDELLADIELTDIRTTAGRLMLNEVLAISFEHGTFGIHFADTAAGKEAAAGRSERFIRLETLRNIRIVVDASCVEVYANDGMEVFSTRWFPAENKLRIRSNFDVSSASVYPLEP